MVEGRICGEHSYESEAKATTEIRRMISVAAIWTYCIVDHDNQLCSEFNVYSISESTEISM
jgi:hypothetical protein